MSERTNHLEVVRDSQGNPVDVRVAGRPMSVFAARQRGILPPDERQRQVPISGLSRVNGSTVV